jgi:hypothetical protein
MALPIELAVADPISDLRARRGLLFLVGGHMGESKVPIYAYVDESGNTGKNIFDPSQPDYYAGALIAKGDFDIRYTKQLNAIAAKVGATAIHANELGLVKLETIASDLYELLSNAGTHFFVSA